MKLRQLQSFCAVVDAGFNISLASEEVHATQPAVGKQIKLLEHELGVPLFTRRGARLTGLTKTGGEVLVWARWMVRGAHNIREITRDLSSDGRGQILLGTTHTHARYVIVNALADFSRRFPAVRLDVLQGTPEGVMEMVADGRADIGITSCPRRLLPEVAAVPFLTSDHVVVTCAGHPLLRLKTLTLQALAQYPIIATNPGRPFGAEVERRFRENGIEVAFAVQALDADVAKTYVAAGLGIGIIPRFTFQPRQDIGLRTRSVAHLFDSTTSVALVRRNSHLKRSASELLRAVSPLLERERIDAAAFDLAPSAEQEAPEAVPALQIDPATTRALFK